MNKKNMYKAIVAIAVALAFILPTSAVIANEAGEITTTVDNNGGLGTEPRSITWSCEMDFSETTGGTSDNVTFGEAPDACDGPTGTGTSGEDDYDVQKAPAPMQPYIRAWFDDGLALPFDFLQEDYRHYPDNYKVWNLTVQWMPSSVVSTDARIEWNPRDLSTEYNSIVLYDVSADTIVANMITESVYDFTAPAYAPTSFQIIATYGYTLTIIYAGTGSGIVTKNPDQGTYVYGTVVELTANPNPDSFFTEWTGDLTGTDNPDNIIMDGDKTVTVTFDLEEYNLHLCVDGTGGGSITPDPDLRSYPHGTVVTLTANPRSDSDFEHWTGDLTGDENPDTITMDGEKTVYAWFDLKEYNLHLCVDGTGSGSITPDPDLRSYPHGTVVTLTANPSPGSFFTEWTGDLTGTDNPDTITMDGEKTVYAWFVQGWDATLYFSANIASIRTDNVTFGESGFASDGIDGLDLPKPPAPEAPYIYTYFDTNLDEPYDVLWKEYREYPADSQVWDLWVEVDTTGVGPTTWVTTTWDTAAISASGYQYVGLHDYSGAFITNMKSTDHYYFEAGNGCGYHFKIICSNICPEAYDDGPYTTNEAIPLYVSAEDGVLDNDVDDGLPGPLTAHIADGTSKGDITLNTDGSFIYTPYLGSVGPDSFTYTAYDGLCHSDPATVYITILEINHIALQYGWNLISNPVDEPIDKTDIIVRYAGYDYTWDQAVGYNIIVGYVYGWHVNGYNFEDTFVPGEGYWVYSYTVCEFLIPSNVVPDNHVNYLDASWNLVGLPYDVDLAKTDLSVQYLGLYYTWDQAVTNGYIANYIYGWDRTNQNYMLSDNFVLEYGYWVYSYVDCVLKIS